MAAKIIRKTQDKVIVEIEVDLSNNTLLDIESVIRDDVNEAGKLATIEALKKFDTDGTPILVNDIKHTSKGLHVEKYESPYGNIKVERHVYQPSSGGKTFCPLENDGRLMLNSTPAYAKLISFKYAKNGGKFVAKDLYESQNRKACPVYVKKISDHIGEIAEIIEDEWEYKLPDVKEKVSTIALGLDGTCMLMSESGWREAMTGTISLYDSKGERLHTTYIGATPQYGKEKFLTSLDNSIKKIKGIYPEEDYEYLGIADGAKENWAFLNSRVDRSILDFYHALEYVKLASTALHYGKRKQYERELWFKVKIHNLKHKHGAAKRFLNEIKEEYNSVPNTQKEKLQKVITYFANNYKKMNYAKQVKSNIPIGSGVTEAACKTLIKQRFCNSGMRWKNTGASAVMAIRSMILTEKKWSQFWEVIAKEGNPNIKKVTML